MLRGAAYPVLAASQRPGWTNALPRRQSVAASRRVYAVSPAATVRSPAPTTHPMIDDLPTRAGFVTALSDAYLVPRDSGYAIFWRTSGHDLCTVDPDVAER